MTTSFSRSRHSLDLDGFGRSLTVLAIVLLLLAGWTVWFFFARVSVYAVTDLARLETNEAVHPLQANVGGRVVAVHMVLGQTVERGEKLIELDSAAEGLALEEEKAHSTALALQIDALRGELASTEQALQESHAATLAALKEARARFDEAEAMVRYSEAEAERAMRLHSEGHIAESELARRRAEASQRRAAADALRLAVERLRMNQQSAESDRRAHTDQLERELAALEGQRATAAARIKRLQEEIDKHDIRAPVAGRIGEVANLQVGQMVDASERIGAVVPQGRLGIRAEFAPPVAAGRVRPGQRARLRLQGFSWTQYGSLAAQVSRVATEARQGRIQVELAVFPDPSTRLPLEHGLQGSVEVEIEQVSPATLVLRAAGRYFARPVAARLESGERP